MSESRILSTSTSLATMAALLCVFVVPLCSGMMATDLCPLDVRTAEQSNACHRPAGLDLRAPVFGCCLSATVESPRGVPSAALQAAAPPPPTIAPMAIPATTSGLEPRLGVLTQPRDLVSLYSSLLL